MTSAIPRDTIAAYRATEYRAQTEIGELVLTMGVPSQQLRDLMVRHHALGAVFITAENPWSQPTSAADNEARQALLQGQLHSAAGVVYEGWGQAADREWPAEASFLALGIDRDQARELGREHQQNAIVWIGVSGTPELLLLR